MSEFTDRMLDAITADNREHAQSHKDLRHEIMKLEARLDMTNAKLLELQQKVEYLSNLVTIE